MSGGGSNTQSINSLLKKTEHYDKDERYMATSDLCEVLKRHAGSQDASSYSQTIDASTERRICTAVLALLDDSSNDVQAIAVKTLGVLLTTVHVEQAKEIAERLCALVLDPEKSELRDVYAIGLKTLVKTVPEPMGDVISQKLVGPLLEGIRRNNHEDITLACLDVLTDLLSRFGSSSINVVRQHETILNITFGELASEKHVVRKRAGNTLGCLSVVLSDQLLTRLVESLLSQIDMAEGVGKSGRMRTRKAHEEEEAKKSATTSPPKMADTRALIRTMCTVSGAVGHRLGQTQIDRILPIFLRFCDPEDAFAEDQDDEHEAAIALANELRESCFAGFESFILRCPSEVDPHLDQIILSALAYMTYDPNYSYDDEDEMEDAASEEEDYEDEDDEYLDEEEDMMEDDDDDESWKVRRSAIRALMAVVEARRHDPSKLWTQEYALNSKSTTFAGALVNRFKEREENCRVDVIDCFTRLLSFTVAAASAGVIVLKTEDSMETEGGPTSIDLQSKYAPAIVKACEKQLSRKKGGERSKSFSLALLSTLCRAPGGMGGEAQIRSVMTHVMSILQASTHRNSAPLDGRPPAMEPLSLARSASVGSKSLLLDALSLVRTMLSCNEHNPVYVKDGLIDILLPDVCQAVHEDWYKVIAQALRVLAEVPKQVVRGYPDGSDESKKEKELTSVASQLYDAIEPRLAAHDVDQEIKECALTASASLLSILQGYLASDKIEVLLALILERLRNETTRIAAIKALSTIAAKETQLDLSSILADTVSELASLMRQQSRGLKQSALEALDVVVQNHGSENPNVSEKLDSVLKDVASLIVESDLHLSHLSLRVTKSILVACPTSGPSVRSHVLPPALDLSKSPLLQDLALRSLLSLLEQLVISKVIEYSELREMLESGMFYEGELAAGKTATSNVAKCIASVTAAAPPAGREAVVADILSTLASIGTKHEGSPKVKLALLVSGDFGEKVDLSSIDGAAQKLLVVYMSAFDSKYEDVKHAAAYALGHASVGAMTAFLPAILEALENSSQKKQYLLLSALRELIRCLQSGSGAEISSSVPVIMPHLIRHCSDSEEGVRTMIAECLGSLTCLHPSVVLPQLQELVEKHSGQASGEEEAKKNALVCSTVATSVKLVIASRVDPSQLVPFMPTFLKLLKEDDLHVKNAALLMVYSAAHHAPQLITPLMQEHILPSLYELSQLNLKRVVDLGPFKHTVDDALPLRKASLSIFATCLENCPSCLDIPAFMPILAKSLNDVEDVQLQAHQIVISMSSRHPTYLVSAVESFVDPLDKTVNKKKGQKTGTELERANEWIKSGLRVMLVLSRLEGTTSCRKFAEFVDRTRKNAKFHQMLADLEEER